MKVNVKSVVATSVVLATITRASVEAAPVLHKIAPGPSATANPLKGLVPYAGPAEFPHSLEWFYLPVSAVQKGEHSFDWTALETKLNEVAARGNQACLRFYYDYPQEPIGIPDYLLKGPNKLPTRSYTDYGGGQCPDYNGDNPGSVRFRQSMLDFITDFGKKYDGDPRIGFITVGLLGFWGEWHTYPHEDWTPSTDVMNHVLDAYVNAFHKTRLEVRYPNANAPKLPIGYHDDAFGSETLFQHEWEFAAKLRSAGIADVWRRQPMGGEVMPPIQSTVFDTGIGDTGEKWSDCVAAVHPTWMLCEQIRHYTGKTYQTALAASVGMGYDFRVKTATFGDIGHGTPLKLALDIGNIGIAPFYYHWPVVICATRQGKVAAQWKTNWDITQIPAGGAHGFVFETRRPGLSAGTYVLSIKVVNPMPNGKPLLFANRGQHPDGSLDLGTFRIL